MNENQVDFFNTQVASAGQALGVEVTDVVFNMQCTPLVTAQSGVPVFMIGTNPSITDASACPENAPPTAAAVEAVRSPVIPSPTSATFDFGVYWWKSLRGLHDCPYVI